MSRTKIGEYHADKGTFVLNAIGFGNGVGDGGFDIYIDNTKYDREKHGNHAAWFDFRDTANNRVFHYHTYDCGDEQKEIKLDMDCDAMVLRFDDGDAVFQRYF